MVTTGALLHGDVERHLRFDAAEHPVALQLGGSEPTDLARSAKLGEQWGYDEINLNCGCPSPRVQRGAFGACLMLELQLVADCVRAMRDAVSVPVTVKCRIGVDDTEDYAFLRDFTGTLMEAGCEILIVHARKAWLKGLSPKQNREIPPLRYELVHQLKAEFSALTVTTNGGLRSLEACEQELQHVDGVMLGREVYENPWILSQVDPQLFGQTAPFQQRSEALRAMYPYIENELAQGVPLPHITRHLLGLFKGEIGGRVFRRLLTEQARLPRAGISTLEAALSAVEQAQQRSAA